MARTEHGTDLKTGLVENPGASFVVSKTGYDSGTRTYTCDADYVANLIPARGTPDATYPGMFVEDVTITNGKAGIATVVVSYKGVIIPDDTGSDNTDADAIQYYVNAQVDAIVIEAAGGISFTKYEPMVTHTYTTTTFPAFNVGEYIDPPLFADKVPASTVSVPVGNSGAGTWTFYYIESGWRLDNRQIQSVGGAYEITDTYLYKYKVESVLSPGGTGYNLDPPQ